MNYKPITILTLIILGLYLLGKLDNYFNGDPNGLIISGEKYP